MHSSYIDNNYIPWHTEYVRFTREENADAELDPEVDQCRTR